ncbi:MAG: hypothetical protein RIC35_00635 [Marinoscillum sp.]
MRTLFILFTLCLAGHIYAQEIVVEDRYDEYFGIAPAGYLSFRNQINLEDYAMGLEFGVINKNRNLVYFGSFDARPYRKRVIRYQGNNLFYQYREERFFIGAGVEYLKRFRQSGLGGFIQVNPEYTWGAYGGSEKKPERGWIITPRIGLYWNPGDFGYFKLGYAYLDSKSYQLDKHRLYLTIAGLLTKDR